MAIDTQLKLKPLESAVGRPRQRFRTTSRSVAKQEPPPESQKETDDDFDEALARRNEIMKALRDEEKPNLDIRA